MKAALVLATLISAPALSFATCANVAVKAAQQLHKQNGEGAGKSFPVSASADLVFARGGIESYIVSITSRNPFSSGGSYSDTDYSVRLTMGACKVTRIKKIR